MFYFDYHCYRKQRLEMNPNSGPAVSTKRNKHFCRKIFFFFIKFILWLFYQINLHSEITWEKTVRYKNVALSYVNSKRSFVIFSHLSASVVSLLSLLSKFFRFSTYYPRTMPRSRNLTMTHRRLLRRWRCARAGAYAPVYAPDVIV